MSLEGTIQDLGLHEVGQLLSLSRKSGVLEVSSVLRGRRAWVRFADGAIVDAGDGSTPSAGTATAAAAAGDRPGVEVRVLSVLAWREGQFAFRAAPNASPSGSAVRIPTDAMLVESVRQEDAWSQLRDRISSPEVVPSFVDVEPKALPLLRLVPQEWEVLTRVDGTRDLTALADILGRELLEVAGVVHRLVGTGLLTVRDMLPVSRPVDASTELPPPRVDGRSVDEADLSSVQAVAGETALEPGPDSDPVGDPRDNDELWIPDREELAVFTEASSGEDAVFDPQRAGLMTEQGLPSASAASETVSDTASDPSAVTHRAKSAVASALLEPSQEQELGTPTEEAVANAEYWRAEGDTAVRRGDFERALTCWSQSLRLAPSVPGADAVREAVALTARLQAVLAPSEMD